jgi:serine/threonine protein phosphatase 1
MFWQRLLQGLRRPEPPPVAPFLPEGERIYCVGDIHGRADLLDELHQRIGEDAAGFAGRCRLVYLGDYIDRGMQSKEVVERLLQPPPISGERIFLRGNHEQTLLDFLDDSQVGPGWLSYGGRETLFSYGVAVAGLPTSREALESLRHALATALPETHREFLLDTRRCYEAGSYFFVHAGVRPGVPIDQQNLDDFLWIRERFIESTANHGRIIVHGHTVEDRPLLLPNRIAIDTGAYASGILTALGLEGAEQRLLQTGAAGSREPS